MPSMDEEKIRRQLHYDVMCMRASLSIYQAMQRITRFSNVRAKRTVLGIECGSVWNRHEALPWFEMRLYSRSMLDGQEVQPASFNHRG